MHRDAEFVSQGCLDDLLLNFAVERDEQFLPDVVLAQVDERVLLCQLSQRGVQRRAIASTSLPTTVSRVGGAK